MTKTKGTKEWAYKNVNCYYGCSNNCTYCYAKRNWERFRKGKYSPQEWEKMETKFEAINKGYKKLQNPYKDKFDVMFPTSHDITKESYEGCIIVLKKLLKAGNTVLITTKPKDSLINKLGDELIEWKDQILFRFTITTTNNELIKKYEPNAPKYKSRYLSVFDAWYEFGYKTSISIEPFLDKDPIYLITRFFDMNGRSCDIITDTIWLGIMSGNVPEELKPNYTIENLQLIIENLKKLPDKIKSKIRLKDSIINKLQLKSNRIDQQTLIPNHQQTKT